MAETLKVLWQANPPANISTDLYAAPSQATISSIVICNQSATDATFRLSVAVAAASDDPKQYLYYNTWLPANDTFIATIGITLGAADVIRIYVTSASISVNVFGVEIS